MFSEYQLAGHHVSLNAAANGPRPGVLLLHGVVRRWQDYGPVLPSISGRVPVLAVDHRGHGQSDRADRYLVVDYIADVVRVLRALTEPVLLVGHSLGGLVAIGAAAEVPERVRGVLLEDPPSENFLGRLSRTPYALQFKAFQEHAGSSRGDAEVARALAKVQLSKGVRLGDRRDAAALRFLAHCLADLDPNVLTPLLEGHWLDGFDPLASAAKVSCPTLLLVADEAEGGMLSPSDAAAFAAALPDSIRIDFPGVGHQIHATQPARYLQLLMNFLDSL